MLKRNVKILKNTISSVAVVLKRVSDVQSFINSSTFATICLRGSVKGAINCKNNFNFRHFILHTDRVATPSF